MYGVLNVFSFREVIHYNTDLIVHLDDKYFNTLNTIIQRLVDIEGNERVNVLLREPEVWMEQFGLPNQIILN